MPIYPLYTEQPYAGTEGKVVLAERVYVADVDEAHPTTKPDGTTTPPTGWTDIGSVAGSIVTLEAGDPETLDYETGLYRVLRGQVAIKDSDVTGKFTIDEYEPDVIATVTGDVTHTVGTGKAIYVGGNPIIQKAILLVGQNPNTQTIFAHWSPKVNLMVKPATVDNRFRVLDVTIRFLAFTDAGDTDGASPAVATGKARAYKFIKF